MAAGGGAFGLYVGFLFAQLGSGSITYSIPLAGALSTVFALGVFMAVTGLGPHTDLARMRWYGKLGSLVLFVGMLVVVIVVSVKLNSYFETRGYTYPGHQFG